MSAVMSGHDQVAKVASQVVPGGLSQRTVRDGIHKPAVSVQIKMDAGMVLLISSPVAVALTMLLGWLVVKSLGIQIFAGEMIGASIVAIVGGILSALPLINTMKYNRADAMAKSAMAGIGIRMIVLLAGAWLAMGPGWGLAKEPLVYWLLAFYFPMLATETGIMAWILKQQDPA